MSKKQDSDTERRIEQLEQKLDTLLQQRQDESELMARMSELERQLKQKADEVYLTSCFSTAEKSKINVADLQSLTSQMKEFTAQPIPETAAASEKTKTRKKPLLSLFKFQT